MVLQLMAIEKGGKGSKAVALAFHSRTQIKLIRRDRAQRGGSNGILYILMQYVVVEYMEMKQLRKGSKATALVIHSRTQAKSIRPYRAQSAG